MTSSPLRQAAAAAFLLGVACSDPTQPFPAQSFTVTPATQWSGGSFVLRSSYFVEHPALPVILAAGETLSVAHVDDSTLTASVPRGPSGPVTLFLVRANRRDSLATIQRVGFREKRTLTPGLMGELLILDSAGHPLVVGNTTTSLPQYAPLGRIDLVSGTGHTFNEIRGPSTVTYGLSPSMTAGTAVARDSADTLRLYTMLTSPPAPVGPPLWGGTTGYVRQLAQLSPGLWLFTSSHWSWTRAETDSCCAYRVMVATESPWSVFISPRGDRTTMTVNVVVGGVPVFDNATGDTAFSLPLRGTEGIAFSPDGGTLYVVGGFYYLPDTLVAVNATTGAMLLPKVHLPDGFIAFGLAYSTVDGGRVLVGAADTTTLAMLVYDAQTLHLLGVLPTPDNCGPNPMTGNCWSGAIVADDARQVAYMVLPDAPTPVWTFDLLKGP